MRLTSSVRERLVIDSNPTSDCQIRAQGERRFLAERGRPPLYDARPAQIDPIRS